MLFVDLGVRKNLTMMMESVFSFLPSYFSIIVLAKGKISKSVSVFLSHIYRIPLLYCPSKCAVGHPGNFEEILTIAIPPARYLVFKKPESCAKRRA